MTISLLNTLNGRERAILVWLLIFLLWSLSQQNIRTSMLGVLKAFFHKKIVIIFSAMFLYVYLFLLIFYKIHILNFSHVKDVVFWIFGSAIALLMNASNSTQDEHHFKKIIRDNLKLIIILEFIITTYTFNFWVEMIFVPVMLFIIGLSTVSEMKKEYLPAKKFLNFTLSLIGSFLISFAVFQLISNWHDFTTLNILRSFILPPLLTLTFIPFLYIFALFMAYENLFIRLNVFFKNDKKLANFTKFKVIQLCLFNLRRVNKFSKKITANIFSIKDRNDILNLINNFDN